MLQCGQNLSDTLYIYTRFIYYFDRLFKELGSLKSWRNRCNCVAAALFSCYFFRGKEKKGKKRDRVSKVQLARQGTNSPLSFSFDAQFLSVLLFTEKNILVRTCVLQYYLDAWIFVNNIAIHVIIYSDKAECDDKIERRQRSHSAGRETRWHKSPRCSECVYVYVSCGCR